MFGEGGEAVCFSKDAGCIDDEKVAAAGNGANAQRGTNRSNFRGASQSAGVLGDSWGGFGRWQTPPVPVSQPQVPLTTLILVGGAGGADRSAIQRRQPRQEDP